MHNAPSQSNPFFIGAQLTSLKQHLDKIYNPNQASFKYFKLQTKTFQRPKKDLQIIIRFI
jgi:hypothetical protein